ncbi:MAG: PDGLE domain-containing protein [Verrucomicrobia bacterium]|nr:PDGLE domain-containing protein [Verrucomicrobiota bacterium]
MHIPDGFLDLKTCLGSFCVAGAGFAIALRKVNASCSDKTVPLLGVMSAFLFAGQTVNFPIGGGISGHLLGSALASIVLGPSGAALVMATVLFVQCLLFQDGGITTLAANFLNLGLVAVGTGSLVFRSLSRWANGPSSLVVPVAVASWCSVLAASLSCALELAGSGTVSLRVVLAPMLVIHAVIGLGEAAITTAMITFLVRVRPDLIYDPAKQLKFRPAAAGTARSHVLAGLAMAVGVVLLATPFSSPLPDGLEALAEKLNFQNRARTFWPAPLPEYSFPGSSPEWLSVSLAVICGIIFTLVLLWGFARWLRRPRTESHAD